MQDIGSIAVGNDDYRRLLYTARNCQLVAMSGKPDEDIGAEIHRLDQFCRVEQGRGAVVLDGVRKALQTGSAIAVPAGARHNIINTGKVRMKLHALYAPPNHRDGVVHRTRADAEADTEHFDGKRSESP